MTYSLKVFWLIIICLYLSILMGLRYRVGLDTMAYMSSYDIIPNLGHYIDNGTEIRYEPLFLLINILCKSSGAGFWMVQIVCATITNTFIFIFLYRYCNNVFVGILIYLYVAFLYFNTEIMRESVAISIFLLNYQNIEKKNFIKYYLLSFLSIGFHFSAIIIWIFPFIQKLRVNLIYILICIGMILITPLVESLNNILAIASISDRMDFYIGGNGLNMNFRLGLLIQNVLPGIVAYTILKIKKRPISFNYCFLLQILFAMGAFAIPIVFQRFINYTQLFTIVMLSNGLSSYKLSLSAKTFITCVIIGSQILYYSGMSNCWIPYVSILNPSKIQIREYMWLHQF